MSHIVQPEECCYICLGRLGLHQEFLVLLIALCAYLRKRLDVSRVVAGTSFDFVPVAVDSNDIADQVREICRTWSRGFPERRLQVPPMIAVNAAERRAVLLKDAPFLRKFVRASWTRM